MRLASLTVTALFIRRMLLPRWSQAPARLAEAVIGVAALVFAAELLGTIGEFRRWHLVVFCVVMAIVATLVFHLRTRARDATLPAKTGDDELTAPNQGVVGLDASNRVDLPAARVEARFAPYETCPSWLLALSTGRYDYVVTARQGERESPAAEWTRRYPGAQQVLAAGPGTERKGNQWRWQLFRLVPGRPVDLQTACHSAQPEQR